MATERDLELLDNFISGKMDAGERAGFEQQLSADPDLMREYKIQSQLIEGIRKARIQTLKNILSNTPVPAPYATSTLVKVGIAVLTAGAIATSVYFWPGERSEPDTTIVNEEVLEDQDLASSEPVEEVTVQEETEAPVETERSVEETVSPQKKQPTSEVKKKASPVVQPQLNPYDPTAEQDSETAPAELDEIVAPEEDLHNASITVSSIDVETDDSSKKYNFHYQFKDNKLQLYGSFEKGLYTILEFFNDNKRTVFLYYNSAYYLLDEAQIKPTPLRAVTDPTLLQKLKEYRGN